MKSSAALIKPFAILVILSLMVSFCGCQTGSGGANQGNRTEVSGTIVSLTGAENGSFRYFGKIRLQTPSRYRGKEIGLFVISHDHDVREFVGKAIASNFDDDDLTKCVEPAPDPFSMDQSDPHLSLEFAGGVFSTIDYISYEKPVPVHGVVRGYELEKDNGGLYFQFDMGYSGDLASVEIVEPAKYRGLIVHVIVYDGARVGSVPRDKWKNRIGTSLAFSVPESTLAWEPWGFTPIEQLGPVNFQAN